MTDSYAALSKSMPVHIMADLAAGISKLAMAWLKSRLNEGSGWTSGSYLLDLDAALGRDVPISKSDYANIADRAQRTLEGFTSSYHLDPSVVAVATPHGAKLYIWFLPSG